MESFTVIALPRAVAGRGYRPIKDIVDRLKVERIYFSWWMVAFISLHRGPHRGDAAGLPSTGG